MVLLAEWNFGILQTWTSEKGLPLFKEKVAEYLPLFCCVVVVVVVVVVVFRPPFARNGRLFASGYSVLKYLWVYMG